MEKETIDTSKYQKENVKYRLHHNIYDEKNTKEKDFINKNLYTNTKTISLLSPMTYNRVYYLMINLGCFNYENTYYECEDTNELLSLLFNVKTDDYYLEKIYTVNSLIKLTDSGLDTTIKDNFEKIIASMTGITDIFNRITLKATEDKENYYFKTDYEYYYIEVENEDGSKSTMPQNYKEFKIAKKDGKNEAIIYVVNHEKLMKIYDYLQTNQINYTYYNDDHLEGDINVYNGKMIFTSIPYDDSWEIKVDDKIVKPTILLDSLIGIEVEPGKHHISMKYKNTNYIGPTIVSVIALIGFIIFNIKRKN